LIEKKYLSLKLASYLHHYSVIKGPNANPKKGLDAPVSRDSEYVFGFGFHRH
jgi:hypothetical protein